MQNEDQNAILGPKVRFWRLKWDFGPKMAQKCVLGVQNHFLGSIALPGSKGLWNKGFRGSFFALLEPKSKNGLIFPLLGTKMQKRGHFALLEPKVLKWAHFRFLAPKVPKKAPETLCLISFSCKAAKRPILGPKSTFGPKIVTKWGFWAPKRVLGSKMLFGEKGARCLHTFPHRCRQIRRVQK